MYRSRQSRGTGAARLLTAAMVFACLMPVCAHGAMISRHVAMVYPCCFGSPFAKSADPDVQEDDDSAGTAVWFGLDGPLQTHNFHDAGDEDWVVFYVPVDGSQTVVSVRTENLGGSCDTVVELYASDGTTLLAANDNDPIPPLDGHSYLLHAITQAGLYFVRVYHWDDTTFGDGTDYALRVWREIGPEIPGSVLGTVVTDSGGAPIAGAEVTVGLFGSFPYWRTESDGSFAISALDAGTYTLYAEAPGHAPGSEVVVLAAGDTVQPTIRLQALAPVLSVTPMSHDFGEVDVGAYAERSFEVSNAGQGLLEGAATASSPFSIVSGGPYSLTAGESQTVLVRFSPTVAGDYSESVSFTGGGGVARPVTGYTPPILHVTPSTRPLGIGGGVVTFSVFNAGGGQMDWTAEVVSGVDWLTITAGAGGANAGEIDLTGQANGTGASRTGSVRVTAPDAFPSSVEVEVIQSGMAYETDVDGNGSTNAVDVQLVVNAALGISIVHDCDVDGDGKANAVDVQLVVNGALGIT